MATNQSFTIHQAIKALEREELERIVLDIHDLLFVESESAQLTVNPEKEWDAQTTEAICQVLSNKGLAPDEEYIDEN